MASLDRSLWMLESSAGERSLMHAELRQRGVRAEQLWGRAEALANAKGRGGVGLLAIDDLQVVVRDYRRGGALRFLLTRSFFDCRRAEREVEILSRLQSLSVPVVEPLAALARRVGPGPCWQLRLATRLWAGARPLPDFVANEPALRAAALTQVGAVVQAAFTAGLEHRDMHPDNFLARAMNGRVEVRMLDLDRCRIVAALADSEREAMLLRMARYVRKHEARVGRWSARDALRFLRGMGLAAADRRHRLLQLQPRLEQELRRHRLDHDRSTVLS